MNTTQTGANTDDLQQDIANGTMSGESAVHWQNGANIEVDDNNYYYSVTDRIIHK